VGSTAIRSSSARNRQSRQPPAARTSAAAEVLSAGSGGDSRPGCWARPTDPAALLRGRLDLLSLIAQLGRRSSRCRDGDPFTFAGCCQRRPGWSARLSVYWPYRGGMSGGRALRAGSVKPCDLAHARNGVARAIDWACFAAQQAGERPQILAAYLGGEARAFFPDHGDWLATAAKPCRCASRDQPTAAFHPLSQRYR
jgi:hypothetical protein